MIYYTTRYITLFVYSTISIPQRGYHCEFPKVVFYLKKEYALRNCERSFSFIHGFIIERKILKRGDYEILNVPAAIWIKLWHTVYRVFRSYHHLKKIIIIQYLIARPTIPEQNQSKQFDQWVPQYIVQKKSDIVVTHNKRLYCVSLSLFSPSFFLLFELLIVLKYYYSIILLNIRKNKACALQYSLLYTCYFQH